MISVEHRLRLVLALLMLGIAGILASAGAGSIIQNPVREWIGVHHLEWEMDERLIPAGTRATILNGSVYWQIPGAIERQQGDEARDVVAESPVLRGRGNWNDTFWRNGIYRVVSADEAQRLAGLEAIISVE